MSWWVLVIFYHPETGNMLLTKSIQKNHFFRKFGCYLQCGSLQGHCKWMMAFLHERIIPVLFRSTDLETLVKKIVIGSHFCSISSLGWQESNAASCGFLLFLIGALNIGLLSHRQSKRKNWDNNEGNWGNMCTNKENRFLELRWPCLKWISWVNGIPTVFSHVTRSHWNFWPLFAAGN